MIKRVIVQLQNDQWFEANLEDIVDVNVTMGEAWRHKQWLEFSLNCWLKPIELKDIQVTTTINYPMLESKDETETS